MVGHPWNAITAWYLLFMESTTLVVMSGIIIAFQAEKIRSFNSSKVTSLFPPIMLNRLKSTLYGGRGNNDIPLMDILHGIFGWVASGHILQLLENEVCAYYPFFVVFEWWCN